MTSRACIIAWASLTIAVAASDAIASTASAFTLPDISIALGATYPIHVEGSLPKSLTTLAGASGTVVSGEGVSLLALINGLSALGPFSVTFLKIVKGATSCNSEGDAAGVVLVKGEFHIVLGPGGTKKSLYVLFLVSTFVVHCGALEIEIRGSTMGTFAPPGESETEEITAGGGKLEGSLGKPKVSEYFNDGGTIVKAKLEAEAGAGFIEASQNAEGEVAVTTLEGKMFTLTGR